VPVSVRVPRGPVLRNQVERDRAVEDVDSAREQRGQQRPVDLRAGRVVARMHDPVMAVPALKSQFTGVEPRPEPSQPVDRPGGRVGERCDHVRLAQPRARCQRVADVRRRAVPGPDRRRQAALRERRRPADQVLGHDQHPQPGRRGR
jgi:hypothetical protein